MALPFDELKFVGGDALQVSCIKVVCVHAPFCVFASSNYAIHESFVVDCIVRRDWRQTMNDDFDEYWMI